MKAYKVHYDTSWCSTSTIVLVEDGQTVEEALSFKDDSFKLDDSYSRITISKELSLYQVMVRDLSATELIKLIKLANQ